MSTSVGSEKLTVCHGPLRSVAHQGHNDNGVRQTNEEEEWKVLLDINSSRASHAEPSTDKIPSFTEPLETGMPYLKKQLWPTLLTSLFKESPSLNKTRRFLFGCCRCLVGLLFLVLLLAACRSPVKVAFLLWLYMEEEEEMMQLHHGKLVNNH